MSKDRLKTIVAGIATVIFGVVLLLLGIFLRSNPISLVCLVVGAIYFTYCGVRYLYDNSKRGR